MFMKHPVFVKVYSQTSEYSHEQIENLLPGLMFRSLIHLSLFLCMVLESVLVSFFYKWLTVFPTPFVKEIVFSPFYILASFVKDKVSTGVWIYLWAFYFAPLIYISVSVPVP